MSLTGDTGNGATLTLAMFSGTTAITAALEIISIQPGEFTVSPVQSSTLATVKDDEKLPGDLADVGESSAEFKYIAGGLKPTFPQPVGTITITFPFVSPDLPTYLTGTGFLTGFQPPTFQNGQLQVGTIKWQWDGNVGPSFTTVLPI
jgi:hypothetical protein